MTKFSKKELKKLISEVIQEIGYQQGELGPGGKGIPQHPVPQGEVNQNITDLVKRIIYDKHGVSSIRWNGPEIQYWLKNFDSILKKFPGAEQALVKKMRYEFGADISANAFYVEYGIPLEFYRKHKNVILSDLKAYNGIKQHIINNLVWRQNKNMPTQQAVQQELSPIAQDFYKEHQNEFPEQLISPTRRGKY